MANYGKVVQLTSLIPMWTIRTNDISMEREMPESAVVKVCGGHDVSLYFIGPRRTRRLHMFTYTITK